MDHGRMVLAPFSFYNLVLDQFFGTSINFDGSSTQLLAEFPSRAILGMN